MKIMSSYREPILLIFGFNIIKLSNVVLNINRNMPANLISQNEYHFSMLAVSLDNWVNLIIEKPFVAQ